MRAYDASVDLGRQTMRLAEEKVSLWRPGAGHRPSSLVVAKDQVIPAHCEGLVMTTLESTLGVENGLVERSPETQAPKGLYIATSLLRDRREVLVRVLNAIRRDQKLTKGSPIAHYEPVTLVIPPDVEQQQVRDPTPKFSFSFFWVGWDSVHLVRRPLIGLLYQPRMLDYDECGAVGGMRIGRGNRSTRRKPAPVALCPP
jgi:hypothetical protein